MQVLRSASLDMRKDEHKRMPDSAPKARLKQDDILRSIHLLISKAEHYIYIENQFFVSAFGASSIDPESKLSPKALVLPWILGQPGSCLMMKHRKIRWRNG